MTEKRSKRQKNGTAIRQECEHQWGPWRQGRKKGLERIKARACQKCDHVEVAVSEG